MLSGMRKDARKERGTWSPCTVRVTRPHGPICILTMTGLGNSSAIGPEMVGAIVTAFLDALYKA